MSSWSRMLPQGLLAQRELGDLHASVTASARPLDLDSPAHGDPDRLVQLLGGEIGGNLGEGRALEEVPERSLSLGEDLPLGESDDDGGEG